MSQYMAKSDHIYLVPGSAFMHFGLSLSGTQLRTLAWVAATFLSVTAQADESQKPWESEPPPYILEDRLRMQASLWNTTIDSIARVDNGTTTAGTTVITAGTTVSAEKDLGLKHKKMTPDFELTLFPGKNHVLRLGSFNSERSADVVLNQNVNFGKDLFLTGDKVRSTMDINMVGLGYGYRVFRARRYELDFNLRVQVATFTTNMQCEVCPARAPGQPLANFNRKADTITLPLPMAGGEGRLTLYKRLDLTARYEWLGATVVDTKGVIRDWQAGLLYNWSQNFGISADYRSYSVHVDSNSNDHPGILDMRYRGWQLGFRGRL
jgi:hypothetical protein